MKTYKENVGFSKYTAPMLFGSIIGIVVCIIALIGFAVLLTAQDIPQKAVYPFAVISAGLGSFFGGFGAGRKAKERGLVNGAFCGIFLFVITFLVGFTFFKDVKALHVIIRAVIMILFSAFGGIASVNLKKS